MVSCAGAGALLAGERATVILDDGQRISGMVTARGGRGGRRRDSRAGELTLLTDDGREVGIPLDRTAVIQFGGGEPTAAEIRALARDSAQTMVRRNGTRESGQFNGIAGDDTVRWQARNGREQLIPFRDLARIYLHADRARTAFDDPGQSDSGFRDGRERRDRNRDDPRSGNRNDSGFRDGNEQGVGRGEGRGGGAGAAQNGEVRVDARLAWTTTGLTVRSGDLVMFRASGRINFGQGSTQNAGPEGNESLKLAEYPVSRMAVGGLIGRVGNGAPFAIGSSTQPIRMPASGTLMLGVNDNELGDNSGQFTVAITRQ